MHDEEDLDALAYAPSVPAPQPHTPTAPGDPHEYLFGHDEMMGDDGEAMNIWEVVLDEDF